MTMKRILFCILTVLCLQGCVPAAIVAGSAACNAVIYDQRSTETILYDHNITYTAQNMLDNDYELRGKTHLSVSTFNGIVLLVGQAPTKAMRDKAECIVKSVPRVKLVHNEITIENPVKEEVCANDVWLTSKVKAVLFAERNLQSSQIKIVTENGVVYLMGLVSRCQAQLATERTSHVVGVCKVVKLFQYI